jgi:hypothetical protein
MKILVTQDATCGNIPVPAGEYWVALSLESNQLTLVAGGKDLKIPAIKRKTKTKTRVTTVSFYGGGGAVWSLVVNTPKHGEWISYINYSSNKKRS